MFGQSPMLPKSAVLDAYVQRVVSRPAFARAQALDDALADCNIEVREMPLSPNRLFELLNESRP